jgi:hypothetical protein
LEADGQSAVLDIVSLWGNVRWLLQTAWRKTALEDFGAAAYQAILLACYSRKVLDGP